MPAIAPLDPAFLSRLETLRLAARRIQWGARLGGRFPINRRGSSVEFADYAQYAPGDDIRSIDWNLYARLERLFVKVYKEEIELSVEVMIDATASMGLPTRDKFARATHLGLCLAYIGLAGRSQVRLSWMRPGGLSATSWCTRRVAFDRLERCTQDVVPSGQVTMGEWVRRAVATLRMHGGQVVWLSDCLTPPAEFFRAMHLLMMKRLEIRVIQVLSPEELQPARLFRGGVVVDSETGRTHELHYRPDELAKAVREHNEQLDRFCKRNGILFVQHRLDEPLETFLLKTLTARGLLE